MANLVRLRGLQALLGRVSSSSSSPVASSSLRRYVGTSGSQKSSGITTPADKTTTCETTTQQIPGTKPGCWVSYGFSEESQYEDRHFLHLISFFVISLCLTFGGWYITYLPDNRYRDWAQREAYLVLRERERAGLPPIDLNMVDPAKVKLPQDDLLDDDDIII